MLFCIIYLFNSCHSSIGVDKAIGYLDDDEEDNANSNGDGDDNDRDLFANISTERALTAENRGIQDFHCAREIKSRNPTKIWRQSANNSLYHKNVVEMKHNFFLYSTTSSSGHCKGYGFARFDSPSAALQVNFDFEIESLN